MRGTPAPSVVTDTCGIITQLHDPDAIAVVDESLDGLVEALARLLSEPDDRVDLGLRARREAEAHFSIHRVAMMALQAYPQAAV